MLYNSNGCSGSTWPGSTPYTTSASGSAAMSQIVIPAADTAAKTDAILTMCWKTATASSYTAVGVVYFYQGGNGIKILLL